MGIRRLGTGHALLALALLVLLAFAAVRDTPSRSPGLVAKTAPPTVAPASTTTQVFPTAADAFIAGAFPTQNTGGASELVLGGDPANGSAYRSLLRFDLAGVPSTAKIVNATMEAYTIQSPAGRTIDADAVRAGWLEGSGQTYLYRQNVTVRESAGVARIREPVDLNVTLPVPVTTFVRADFRIFDDRGAEVPSQVYGAVYAGANVTRIHIVFGATVAAHATRTYVLGYKSIVPSVPTFRTRTFGQLLWSYPVGSEYAPLTAADLDGDGRLEVVVASGNGTITALHWNGTGNPTVMWSHKATDVIGAYASAVDLDGDGRPEILYATTGTSDVRIYALHANGSAYWNSGIYPGKAAYAPIAVSDVDHDGVKELFFGASDGYLYSLNGNNGTLRWRYALPGGLWGYGAAVGNLTGDARPEIVYTASNGAFYALHENGTLAWVASPGRNSAIVTPSLGDFGTPGTLDVVAGDTSVSGSEFAFRGTDGGLIWSDSTQSDQFGGQVLVDFNGDGKLETVFAMTRKNALGAVDSLGTHMWTAPTNGSIYGVPSVADVTLDGVPEALVGSFDQSLYVVNALGRIVARFPEGDIVSTTPIVADLDGDGTMEIISASRSAVFAYSTGSLGHDFRIGGYNYNNTGRFLDGNSPDGAPLLAVSLGPVQTQSGAGVTWLSRDGTAAWAVPGADYQSSPIASALSTSSGWLSWNVTGLVQAWANGSVPNVGILLKAADESLVGLSLLGSREGGAAQAAFLRVLYYEDVSPRFLQRVPDQVALEDSPAWSLNLTGYAYDPDTPTNLLRWGLGGVNHNLYDVFGGNITGNALLRFQPKPNAFGSNRATLFVFDPQGHYASQPLWVNITWVDDPPIFTPPAILYVKYGQPYTFDFSPYISDIDTPKANLTLMSDDPVHAATSGLTATFSYTTSVQGDWAFVVMSVSDGTYTTSEPVAIRLTSDAPPTLVSPLPDVTLLEKQTRLGVFDLSGHFSDPEGDVLQFSARVPSGLSVTIHANGSVDIAALGNYYGNATVTFRARDSIGAFVEDSIIVTVIAVNDPPVIGDIPPFVVHYGVLYQFDLGPHIMDPDTPLSQITVTTSLSPYITVNGTVLDMLFPQTLGPLTEPYVLPLTLYANDGMNTTSRTTTVSVGNDFPPQLRAGRALPDEVFPEDTWLFNAFNLDDYFVDVDSSTIFYWSGPQHVRVTINGNHSVDFNSTLDWNGQEYVTFRASDNQGAYAEDTILVTVTPVNDPPYFKNLTAVVSPVGTFVLDLANHIGDVDTNVSFLTLQTSDPYVRVEGFVLVFSYPGGYQEDTVNLTLSDGQAATYANLKVLIEPFNPLVYLLPIVGVAAALLATLFVVRVVRTQVRHAFLIYRNGLMLMHVSSEAISDRDPDLIASMFSAIQSFIDESFHSMGVGQLKAVELADHRVIVVRGADVSLVVLYRGAAAGHVESRAREVIRDIERRYGRLLSEWNGDVALIAGAEVSLERLFPARVLKQIHEAAADRGDVPPGSAQPAQPK